jgi:uncharacterized protein YdaT
MRRNSRKDHSMPWTVERYPSSMKRLHPIVRVKAIEIANAPDEGHPEGQAIRIGIARARDWTMRRGLFDRDKVR